MTTVTLRRMPIEVGCLKKGRPSYRWVDAYVVVRPDGIEEYPPVRHVEAHRRARALGAKTVVVSS